MNIDITKNQQEIIAANVDLCMNFIKNDIQPHLTSSDRISVDVCDDLLLCLTNNSAHIVKTVTHTLFLDFSFKTKQTFILEKGTSKKEKKYLCEKSPELAYEFLQNWQSVKEDLLAEVNTKKEEVGELNDFIGSFKV